MKKMSHKNKIKMARKMTTKKETKEHTPIFQSNEWNKRKEAKKLKMEKLSSKNKKKKNLGSM